MDQRNIIFKILILKELTLKYSLKDAHEGIQ